MIIFSFFLAAYFVGSIPFAYLVAKFTRNIDIRKYGSGNSGATNAFRILGWKLGTIVLILDIAKGLIPTMYFASYISLNSVEYIYVQFLMGIIAILGHTFSVFLNFKGGKGVATATGMLIGISPITTFIAFLVFLITTLITRYISLASILGTSAIPVIIQIERYFFNFEIHVAFDILTIILAIFIILTHRTNIVRIIKGEENKFGQKKEN
jgi:glycerol-3-phosphate acyltransferase PlsY